MKSMAFTFGNQRCLRPGRGVGSDAFRLLQKHESLRAIELHPGADEAWAKEHRVVRGRLDGAAKIAFSLQSDPRVGRNSNLRRQTKLIVRQFQKILIAWPIRVRAARDE